NKAGEAQKEQDSLEFNGAPVRTMSVELLFDGYEEQKSIAPLIKTLEDMSSVRKAESKEPEEKRPHFCVVVWGEEMPPFRCVIEGLTVKYTMFSTRGSPLRAVCTVKLKEARLRAKGAAAGQAEITRRANAPAPRREFNLE